MANLLLLATLLAASHGHGSALKGAEAYQQLVQFEKEYDAKAMASGDKINFAERSNAIRAKAESLVTGVSADGVAAEEGLAWSHVFDAAHHYADSVTVLKRFLTTDPTGGDAFQAKLGEARDYLNLADVKSAKAILVDLAPTDEKTATLIAGADSTEGRYLGDQNPQGGIDFIDQVSPKFQAYPKAADLLTRTKATIKMNVTRGTLVGHDAPELSILSDKYGDYANLASLKGKVVILDFFAHWCPPCKLSFPAMKKLEEELGDKAVFVGVTAYYGYYGKDKGISQADEFKDMKQFMADFNIDHPVVYVDRSQFATYGVTGIPEFVIIGKDGKVKNVTVGYSANLFQRFRDAALEAAK